MDTLFTQFVHEKRWVKTSTSDALKIIKDEMPQTDANATLMYIKEEIKKGKIVTLGECRFSNSEK